MGESNSCSGTAAGPRTADLDAGLAGIIWGCRGAKQEKRGLSSFPLGRGATFCDFLCRSPNRGEIEKRFSATSVPLSFLWLAMPRRNSPRPYSADECNPRLHV